ncbi:SDR family NAD(P)-dependent oxidoreductase [Haliea sp. E17]|uniref:SDR family NAD(P)-dependent oxidoreductase n=1 Tax=Haliea sp. E17 TaxID=3401576 RepID=UPI003AADACE0
MRRLENKVIFVAGAGGIGGGLARRYAEEGARVLLGDIDLAAAEEVVQAINDAGHSAASIRLDGSDEDSVNAAVSFCVEKLGGLDGLHANFASLADSNREQGILELPLETFDLTQRVNVRGYYLCTRAALPVMLAAGGGSIVYTSSIGAYTGGAAQVAYSMSKAAGHALMRHVATRYGPQGVRANTIAPGLILHPAAEAEISEELLAMCCARASIKSRTGRPTDIAALGALLLSDEGGYITGQVICVDGGTTMRA